MDVSPYYQCKCKPYTVDLRWWQGSAEAIKSPSTSVLWHICKPGFLSVSVILPRVSCIAGEAKLFIMLSSTDTIQYRVTFLVGVRYLTVRGSLVAQGMAQVAQHLSAYQGDFSVTCSHQMTFLLPLPQWYQHPTWSVQLEWEHTLVLSFGYSGMYPLAKLLKQNPSSLWICHIK